VADSDPKACPKCGGPHFVIYDQVYGPNHRVVGRVLECSDCRQAEFDKMISELSPTKGLRYSKTKLKTEYYGTVTVKDIIKDDNET